MTPNINHPAGCGHGAQVYAFHIPTVPGVPEGWVIRDRTPAPGEEYMCYTGKGGPIWVQTTASQNPTSGYNTTNKYAYPIEVVPVKTEITIPNPPAGWVVAPRTPSKGERYICYEHEIGWCGMDKDFYVGSGMQVHGAPAYAYKEHDELAELIERLGLADGWVFARTRFNSTHIWLYWSSDRIKPEFLNLFGPHKEVGFTGIGEVPINLGLKMFGKRLVSCPLSVEVRDSLRRIKDGKVSKA